MNIFKKKKKAGTKADVNIEIADKAEGDEIVEVKSRNPFKKNSGAFGRFKKKFRIRIKLRGHTGEGDEADATQGGDKDTEKKPKKQKKPKIKKEKKPKASKPKKSGDESEGDSGKKKIKPIVLIAIAGAGILVGVAAFFIVKHILDRPSVAQQLTEARLLVVEKKYDEASAAYQNLIKKDKTLVEAYIGLSDSIVGNGDAKGAIDELSLALEPTANNPLIQAKIDEITSSLEASAATPGVTAPAAPSTAPIAFKDPEFEKMLRIAMKKTSGESISEADVASITLLKILGDTHASLDKSLESYNRNDSYEIDGVKYTERGKITTLDDLKYFKKLTKLIIAYNSVTDISGIAELQSLGTIGLYCNEITDISPLSGLDNLEFLYIFNNKISDISAIASLTKLQQLWLDKNNITDISPVKNLTELTEIYIRSNEVTDISPIAKLSKLGFFIADYNKISDISALKDMASLTDASFLDNPVTDFSPASHIQNLNKSIMG